MRLDKLPSQFGRKGRMKDDCPNRISVFILTFLLMSNAVFNIVMNVLTNETKQIHTLGDLVCIKSDIKKITKIKAGIWHQWFRMPPGTPAAHYIQCLGLSPSAASDPSFLLMYMLETSSWWLKVLNPCNLCGTPYFGSNLMVLAWYSPASIRGL